MRRCKQARRCGSPATRNRMESGRGRSTLERTRKESHRSEARNRSRRRSQLGERPKTTSKRRQTGRDGRPTLSRVHKLCSCKSEDDRHKRQSLCQTGQGRSRRILWQLSLDERDYLREHPESCRRVRRRRAQQPMNVAPFLNSFSSILGRQIQNAQFANGRRTDAHYLEVFDDLQPAVKDFGGPPQGRSGSGGILRKLLIALLSAGVRPQSIT